MRMRLITLSLVLLMSGCAMLPSGPRPLRLGDLRDWQLVLAADATPSERYAAAEFQRVFALAAGQELSQVAAPTGRGGHVFVGADAVRAHTGVAFDATALGEEGYRLVVTDRYVAIAGGRPRGTLYGVYAFLEDCLDVRFLTSEHTGVPLIVPERLVGPLDRSYTPPLEFRYTYYGENNQNPQFAVRLRQNAIPGTKPEWGGLAAMRLTNHSFGRQVPLAKYGKEHPEYFAERDGKRRVDVKADWDWHGTQPCLTNPDVLRIVTASVLADLTAHPEWRNISVSMNDNNYYCQCAACKAVDEAEGSPMGSLLRFVNAVADEVATAHPGVMVGTLSYLYSRKPPKLTRPRPNVQIQLCSIEACVLHAIDDPACPKNRDFCQDMADWGKLCNQIYIWNYNTNFHNYLLPCPNLRVLGPNVRYFLANHARGIFMQAAGNAMSAELSDLRNYVISRLLWDPTADAAALQEEFLVRHYGRCAPPLRRYLAYVHDQTQASGLHRNCFGEAADYGITPAVVAAGRQCFADALALAGDDATLRRRVEKAAICLERAALEPIWTFKTVEPFPPEVAAAWRPQVAAFLRLCRAHGVTMVAETLNLAGAEKHFRVRLGMKPDEPW